MAVPHRQTLCCKKNHKTASILLRPERNRSLHLGFWDDKRLAVFYNFGIVYNGIEKYDHLVSSESGSHSSMLRRRRSFFEQSCARSQGSSFCKPIGNACLCLRASYGQTAFIVGCRLRVQPAEIRKRLETSKASPLLSPADRRNAVYGFEFPHTQNLAHLAKSLF